LPLVVPRWFDAKTALPSKRCGGDRDKVDAARFRAIDREIIDLAKVVASGRGRIRVMRVAAAAFEADGSFSKPAGLALDSRELSPVVDDEIGSRIFTEWEIDLPAVRVKGESNRER
jgi:hypothetical protein